MGTISVEIDKITECLIDVNTGKEVKTIVTQIKHTSKLKGFNTKEWYVNWGKLLRNNEVFALKTEDGEIQGLAAIENDLEAQTAVFSWAVAAPWNNPEKLNGQPKKYMGVGAHLFAIAVDRSMSYGYDGVILGHPSDRKIMQHYIDELGAEEFPISTGYAYTIVLWEDAARRIKEAYDYEKRY